MNANDRSRNVLTFTLVGGPYHGEVVLLHLQELPKVWTSVRLWKNPSLNRIQLVRNLKEPGEEYLPRDDRAASAARNGVGRLFHIHHDVGFESKVGSLLDDFDLTNADIIFKVKGQVDKSLLSGLYHFGFFYSPEHRGIILRTALLDHPALAYAKNVCRLELEQVR